MLIPWRASRAWQSTNAATIMRNLLVFSSAGPHGGSRNPSLLCTPDAQQSMAVWREKKGQVRTQRQCSDGDSAPRIERHPSHNSHMATVYRNAKLLFSSAYTIEQHPRQEAAQDPSDWIFYAHVRYHSVHTEHRPRCICHMETAHHKTVTSRNSACVFE